MAKVTKTYEGCDCPHCMLCWAYMQSAGNAGKAMFAIGALVWDVMRNADSDGDRLLLAQAMSSGGHARERQVDAQPQQAPDLEHDQMANEKPV